MLGQIKSAYKPSIFRAKHFWLQSQHIQKMCRYKLHIKSNENKQKKICETVITIIIIRSTSKGLYVCRERDKGLFWISAPCPNDPLSISVSVASFAGNFIACNILIPLIHVAYGLKRNKLKIHSLQLMFVFTFATIFFFKYN